MEYIRVTTGNMIELKTLQLGYKQEIGEDRPTDENFDSLREAISKGQIIFYGCMDEGRLIACCSSRRPIPHLTIKWGACLRISTLSRNTGTGGSQGS